MRELAYVQQIKALKPIPGADAIECAEILGWEVVVKKGDFQVDDLVIYCEIDSVLPELPAFEFLRPRKFRIKTVKLRGQISQGIAFPLSTIHQVDPTFKLSSLKIGQDVTDLLKITKYDPEATLDQGQSQAKKSWLASRWSWIKWKLFGFKPTQRDSFPSDVPKTDEERVQKMGSALLKRQGQEVYITEKLEGTSATFIYRRHNSWLADLLGKSHTFQVCSRNRIVFDSSKGGQSTSYWMQVAEEYDLRGKLRKLNRNLALQGEIIGPGIQKNVYKLSVLELRLFLIFDLDKRAYLPYSEFVAVAQELDLLVVPMVDIYAILQNSIKHYVDLSKGKSQINPTVLREGIVIRSLTDNFSFKSINPEYLLKQEQND